MLLELKYFNISSLEWEPAIEPYGLKGLIKYSNKSNPKVYV